MSITFTSSKAESLTGDIRVPGDKSISHRSIMFGSLANGTTNVTGFLMGNDNLATLNAFRAMGVEIEGPNDGKVTIHGVGMNGLKQPSGALDMGNSGTSIRLISGIVAGQSFPVELFGDRSLSKRPMGRVINPLAEMGAVFESNDGKPPVKSVVSEGKKLNGIHYVMPMASAQVKSCVLLAGLFAEGETSVVEPAPTRDHTERMLKAFGYDVQVDGSKVTLQGGGKLTATDIDVPSDISSATFFMVAALIAPNADLTIRHVGMNPTRVGSINILRKMGGDITLLNEREVGGEPVADIRVRSSELVGIDVDESDIPLAIDEFPVIFVAAANAKGTTRLRNAEELRVKESDRIQVMADGLTALGVNNTVVEDGIDIIGGEYHGGVVESHDDHRIGMSFSVAGIRSTSPITIKNCETVATSFPNFVELATQVGMQVSKETDLHV